jgi:hypothetical protein
LLRTGFRKTGVRQGGLWSFYLLCDFFGHFCLLCSDCAEIAKTLADAVPTTVNREGLHDGYPKVLDKFNDIDKF